MTIVLNLNEGSLELAILVLKKWGLDAGKIRGVGALALGYAGRAPGRAAPRKKDYIIKV